MVRGGPVAIQGQQCSIYLVGVVGGGAISYRGGLGEVVRLTSIYLSTSSGGGKGWAISYKGGGS